MFAENTENIPLKPQTVFKIFHENSCRIATPIAKFVPVWRLDQLPCSSQFVRSMLFEINRHFDFSCVVQSPRNLIDSYTSLTVAKLILQKFEKSRLQRDFIRFSVEVQIFFD